MAQKRISRFPLDEKFSGLSGLIGHVPNYALEVEPLWFKLLGQVICENHFSAKAVKYK